MQVAAGMMAGCLPAGSCAARIMLFAGGPPTIGSGKVVDMELTEPIRYPATHWAIYCAVQHAVQRAVHCNTKWKNMAIICCLVLYSTSAVYHICFPNVFD